jgi:hypothetical protein
MRKKSALLGFAAAGAIVLSTVATTLPASAAPVTSLTVSSSTLSTQGSSTRASSFSPDSAGSVVCEGNLCIQRITSVVNNAATVEAWADGYTFTGHFELSGPDGLIGNSKNQTWVAGGTGHNFSGVPAGGGYTMTAWEGTPSTGYHDIGQVNFAV